VLIGFSNGIRGAKRLTAPKALGDSDNDMSCHAARNETKSRTLFCVRDLSLGENNLILQIVEYRFSVAHLGEKLFGIKRGLGSLPHKGAPCRLIGAHILDHIPPRWPARSLGGDEIPDFPKAATPRQGLPSC
jgi:hypothetical protein